MAKNNKTLTVNDRAALQAILRSDFSAFLQKCFHTIFPGTQFMPNWSIDALCHELMLVHKGKTTRLLINQPPRSLKSLCVSIAYSAWVLGHDQTCKIIVASYSADFAAELHRQHRMVIRSEWYRSVFPDVRTETDTDTEFVTDKGGGRLATSVGGPLTGRGADIIIVDDPLKAEDATSIVALQKVNDWFGRTLLTRLNDKNSDPIIVVQQRLHENDLSGHLLKAPNWRHLNLQAIAEEDTEIEIGPNRSIIRRRGDVLHPERESKEVLDELKISLGSFVFSPQYQQRPVPVEGNLVKREWFKYFEQRPVACPGDRVVQSWDVAMTVGPANDYSVCTTWQWSKSGYYLLHVFRDRLSFPELRRKVITHSQEFGAHTILIENIGPGMALLQDLRFDMPNGMTWPIGQKPDGSKVERLAAQTAKIEAGQVHVLKEAPWLDIFLNELLAFPNGQHDDQVDSVSQFLCWVGKSRFFKSGTLGVALPIYGDSNDSWSA